MGLG
ncbi:hypothetical protein AYI68_g3938, partial [Smittium mucronatum]|jgi:hypothetical protein